jgi:CheY-like chemotaxis protein
VVARLRDVGYLRQGRRTVAAGDRFRLSPAGRALVAADRRVEEAPLATGLAPVGVPPATPTRILVVDDDEAIRAVLTGILCDEGYLVETAADGAEALAAVARERPSAVLLDMHMPVLDGWGFVAGLRQRGIRVPIAVMTAARDVRVTCDEVAGDACLAKPFVLDAVVDTVARVCVT